MQALASDDVFALDVQIITDATDGQAGRGCDTNDGCIPTCVSACASRS